MVKTRKPQSTNKSSSPVATEQQYKEKYKELYGALLEEASEQETKESDDSQGGREGTNKTNSTDGERQALTREQELSRQLQELITNNSDIGSRLLSLLLVCTGNAKEIIDQINSKQGDLSVLSEMSLDRGKRSTSRDEALASEEDSELSEEARRQQMEKRKRNTEASARFRIRKKLREQEKLSKLRELHIEISQMYRRIDELMEENRYWKGQLEELNEKRSEQLLDSIKRRNRVKEAEKSTAKNR